MDGILTIKWAIEYTKGKVKLLVYLYDRDECVVTKSSLPLKSLSEAQRAQASERWTIIRSALEDGKNDFLLSYRIPERIELVIVNEADCLTGLKPLGDE